jgi:hypothetical protein
MAIPHILRILLVLLLATIPPTDKGGLSIATLNRMIEGAVKRLIAPERR